MVGAMRTNKDPSNACNGYCNEILSASPIIAYGGLSQHKVVRSRNTCNLHGSPQVVLVVKGDERMTFHPSRQISWGVHIGELSLSAILSEMIDERYVWYVCVNVN